MDKEKVMFLNHSNVTSGHVRKRRSPCSSPITGRQLDTCYQVICLAAGQNPYTVNPFRPPGPLKRAGQPRCGWIQEGETDVTRPNHSH